MSSVRAPISDAFLAALQEAFVAASLLVPPSLRPQFVLVGSGAMLYHGFRRRAEDLDIVGTANAHGAFLDGARGDERFSVMADGGRVYIPYPYICLYFTWLNPCRVAFIQYTSVAGAGAGFVISIDLVALGDEAMPFVASLPELWRMKA
ncbi:uncharacterized protein K460DRAFT_408951 [Cucurbitaria berberidis CBS 394.84]|uniref:Uncharacterized protein n=1 Tax=Cucurbitaria berberidis CBS 394.84 TaxID=1168544 RepID=A0A9P4G9H1_9PLEO|nr:uncharacterized protein K460DRAFT_408951 [Cucurbitaria berberidis CBS 394.84]KAF1841486.1 hypothetical protein K460DRAFT_408951 [Cucurbitaria berberidis CBS 394.84]